MTTRSRQLDTSLLFSSLTPGQQEHVMAEHGDALGGIHAAFSQMELIRVKAGVEVVRHREVGDRYYIIKSGSAEVWRPDLETDAWLRVAQLHAGDVFGEEALLAGGYRNATVRMTTDGVLLALDQDVFDSTLRSRLAVEVPAAQAMDMATQGDTEWLDCRFAIEYAGQHIPQARLVPLDVLRDTCQTLDRGKRYLVYCQCGQRSICATYLLRERGFDAVSVMGGLRDWPYEVEYG